MAERAWRQRLGLAQAWMLLKLAAVEWWNDNTLRLAAALAFYTIFSLAPLLVIATGIAGLVFDSQATTDRIVRELESLIGGQGASVVRGILTDMGRQSGGGVATAIGIAALVVGSTAVFGELQAALNQVWDVKVRPTRGFWMDLLRDRLLSFGMVIGIGFLLLVSLLLSAAISGAHDLIAQRMPEQLAWIWQALDVTLSLAIITALFVLMYKVLPDVELAWSDVFIGALVTAACFSVGKYAIGLYLGRASFASYYGAAGSFVVLLFWVYYSALVCFFGAEFTHVYAKRFGSGVRPQRHAERAGRKPDDPTAGEEEHPPPARAEGR